MFKRVMLCYDGSARGRRALRHGAELAITLGAEITILAIVTASLDTAMYLSRSSGHLGFDSEEDHQNILDDAIRWLHARGVTANAYLAHGEVIDVILDYAKRLGSDLIVVGQYPKESRTRWWTSNQRTSLSEHSTCSILISVGE